MPTEAGDALLAYARRIIALNDEAAASLSATTVTASVRMGLPQDFFEDVMPDAIRHFMLRRPGLHAEVQAGRNHILEEEVRAGRLDVAVAFFKAGSDGHGTRIASLPMLCLGGGRLPPPPAGDPAARVLFDHPCLFRQEAIQTLEREKRRWRLSLTTPSLPGVWAALRMGHGISVRTTHRIPSGVRDVGAEFGLPELPPIELRLLTAGELSPAASDLRDIVERVVRTRVAARRSGSPFLGRRRAAGALAMNAPSP